MVGDQVSLGLFLCLGLGVFTRPVPTACCQVKGYLGWGWRLGDLRGLPLALGKEPFPVPLRGPTAEPRIWCHFQSCLLSICHPFSIHPSTHPCSTSLGYLPSSHRASSHLSVTSSTISHPVHPSTHFHTHPLSLYLPSDLPKHLSIP